MAKLLDGIKFIGSIGGITAYKRSGSPETFIRSKSGISGERIKTAPEFELTRQNNQEFGACSKAGAAMRHALVPVSDLRAANFNINNQAIKLAKVIQRLDTTAARGERSIQFSTYRHLLKGFCLNPRYRLEGMLRASIDCQINRTAGTAMVQLPALQPGINFLLPWKEARYRFVAHLSVIQDIRYAGEGYHENDTKYLPGSDTVYTSWRYPEQRATAEEMHMQLLSPALVGNDCALLLSLGLELGYALSAEIVNPVLKKGTAQIIEVG